MEELNKKLKELKSILSDAMITQIDLDLKIKLICKLNEAINYTHCCKSVKGGQVPTFDEFITDYGLEVDRDNEYFFDNAYYTFEGLYYKYAEHYGINP